MVKVLKVELDMPVYVRKHEVDKEGLQHLLRRYKKLSGYSNKWIAEILSRPVTEVEHWFRTDSCWSVPDAEIWHTLKWLLNIQETSFDAQVTEYIERSGVFEKSNRFYLADGIAPTLTSTSADEKIIYHASDLQKSQYRHTFKGGNTLGKVDYIELFAGIGGFRQAIDNHGGNCVFASEIDVHAKKTYEALYGGEELHGDIMQVDEKDVPDHQLLVGGFPCQAFSVAGNRLGFEDTRGTLFFEALRIAKEKRPRVLLLENVKGLVNHAKGDTLSVMLHALNEIGYLVDFDILNSKHFGVPQNRERIFIVAAREDVVTEADWTENMEGSTMLPKARRRLKEEGLRTFNFKFPKNDTVTTRLRDVLETDVDEKYYLSEDKTQRLVAQLEGKQLKDTEDCDMVGHIDLNGHDYLKRVFSPDGVSNTLTTMGGGNTEPKIAELQGLPIKEATTQGFAMAEEGDTVNFQFPDSTTRRGRVGKQIANTLEASNINQGVVELAEPEAVRAVLTPDREKKQQNGRRFKENDEEMFTLTGQDKHGIALGEVRPVALQNANMQGRRIKEDDEPTFTVSATDRHGVLQGEEGMDMKYRIRKLTPLECWRLQGFPDEAFHKAKAAGVSDSQLYKQSGNAVTVNVIDSLVGAMFEQGLLVDEEVKP